MKNIMLLFLQVKILMLLFLEVKNIMLLFLQMKNMILLFLEVKKHAAVPSDEKHDFAVPCKGGNSAAFPSSFSVISPFEEKRENLKIPHHQEKNVKCKTKLILTCIVIHMICEEMKM